MHNIFNSIWKKYKKFANFLVYLKKIKSIA